MHACSALSYLTLLSVIWLSCVALPFFSSLSNAARVPETFRHGVQPGFQCTQFAYTPRLAPIWHDLVIPKHLSSFLFLFLRYFSLLATVTSTLLSLLVQSDKSCLRAENLTEWRITITQFTLVLLLTLRVYALYGKSLRVLIFPAILALTLASVVLWSLIAHHEHASNSDAGCLAGLDDESAFLMALDWELALALDLYLFVMTVMKTRDAALQLKTNAHVGCSPLIMLMLRDGAIYFVVIALGTISNVWTFYAADPILKGSLSTFATSVSVITISRLMLNLHEVSQNGIFLSGPSKKNIARTSGMHSVTEEV